MSFSWPGGLGGRAHQFINHLLLLIIGWVQICRSTIAECLVMSLHVVKFKIAAQFIVEVWHGIKLFEVDQLVLNRTPEPFYKNVIDGSSLTIHADLDTALLQNRRKVKAGELTPLICIKDYRLANSQC